MIEAVKEPTKSLIMLIVFASMRPGEVLALRWKDIQSDRIVVDERVYDDEFDDVKTDAGRREVPFDKHGVILAAIQRMWIRNKKYRKPDDLVFANKFGRPIDRHNLLNRQVKPMAEKLGLPKTVDFRSFRTMHASLMRRFGARLEVARDNMGHAGSTGSITLDVYSKTWWNERVEAVTRVVEAVFAVRTVDEGRYLFHDAIASLSTRTIGEDEVVKSSFPHAYLRYENLMQEACLVPRTGAASRVRNMRGPWSERI